VEVPSREGRAKDRDRPEGHCRSENRVDQRMPLEPITGSLLPSKASVRGTAGPYDLPPHRRKPDGDVCDKAGAVSGVGFVSRRWTQVEGLLDLVLKTEEKARPGVSFCLSVHEQEGRLD
jgi:hypothetical protein